MQTILGSGGAIGTDLAHCLTNYTTDIKLVSRNPVRVNSTDILQSADLSDSSQVEDVIKGSEICYVTVGFEYNVRAWRRNWPPFMKSVVGACIRHECTLVFFDNVYALGCESVHHMTELSRISPSSEKGQIRASLDNLILEEMDKGRLQAIIARAPDFFGPVKRQNSVMMNLVYDNLAKGKTAQWFCNADVIHTMGYAPDLAKGTAILGNSPTAYNQVWNLPVDMNGLTGREWVKVFAQIMNTSDRVKVVPVWNVRLLGIFIPVLREMPEMMYQFDRPYQFDCTKFITAFNYTATSNRDAVKQTIEQLLNNTGR